MSQVEWRIEPGMYGCQAWFILGHQNVSFIREQSRLASYSTTLKAPHMSGLFFSHPSKLLSWLSLLHPSDLWAYMLLLFNVGNYHLVEIAPSKVDPSLLLSLSPLTVSFVACIPVGNHFLLFTYSYIPATWMYTPQGQGPTVLFHSQISMPGTLWLDWINRSEQIWLEKDHKTKAMVHFKVKV